MPSRSSSVGARKSGTSTGRNGALKPLAVTATTSRSSITPKPADCSSWTTRERLSCVLSQSLPRRNGEAFFWKWLACWIVFFSCIVVTGVYEAFDPWHYLAVGGVSSIPPIVLPLLCPSLSGEEGIAWHDRYTTKANLFVFVWSWVGNYAWTHFFYNVLGTRYTFAAHCLNEVPLGLYGITHSYFLLYHLGTSAAFRWLWGVLNRVQGTSTPVSERKASYWVLRGCATLALTVGLGYTTAVLEVASIASFPYYTYPDSRRMWMIGSLFYAIDFIISYPFFATIDEDCALVFGESDAGAAGGPMKSVGSPKKKIYSIPLYRLFIEAMGYAMVTSLLLDAWRLYFGALNSDAAFVARGLTTAPNAVCVPWW